MGLSFAPAFRLSSYQSHVVVDLVFGLGLALLTIVMALAAAVAWRKVRRLRAETHELRPGPILLEGTAQPIDDQPSATPFIELVITQHAYPFQGKNGPSIRWKEIERRLDERPFRLRTDRDDEVLVLPDQRIDLIDRLEPAERIDKWRRTRAARVVPGERLWVRGELRRGAGTVDDGPYRGAGGPRWELRPPGRAPLIVASIPIDADLRASARRRTALALLCLAAFGVLQGLVYSGFRALRKEGVVGHAAITSRSEWRIRRKHGYDRHFAWDLSLDTPRGRVQLDRFEVDGAPYLNLAIGASVPVTYLPSDPSVAQVGSPDELGVSENAMFVPAMILCCLLAILGPNYRRPWWRARKVVEYEQGSL